MDLTETDVSLLKYTAYLCEVFPVKDVILLHNVLLDEPPKELQDLYPETSQPIDKLIRGEITDNIREYLPGIAAETDIKIFQNETTSEIIKWVNAQEVDVSILGNKPEGEGQGIFSTRFLRLTTQAVLLVPENAPFPISKVLSPVDFSKSAIPIIRSSTVVSEAIPAEINYLHLYSLPPQHFPYLPPDMNKFREGYVQYGKEEFRKLREKALEKDGQGECEMKLIERGDVAHEIYQWAQRHKSDLIIAGAKGKNNAEVLILGSETEKLTTIVKDIPLLIVKRKAHYSWLESFLD
ncbi:universal stress protein [Porifericola rhodea]|uniref:universal stress protein n=1 Tax=Porifericola rhodea TaxID=930972 RepID=UPI002666AF03|nr:universal stress protein [Porifericola rhodea]WKN32218.1 universal stress protein [Porifericola rhodea]